MDALPAKVSLDEKFSRFADQWRPKLVGELNGQEVKLVKLQGDFVWHRHDEADELFLVWRGSMRIEFRRGVVTLGPGEMLIVPRGLEHRTAADDECEALIFEPAGVRNTGDVADERLTAPSGVRV